MKISIRYKLLIYMTVNIFIFALLLYGSNIFFAEKYYMSNKKSNLIETGKKISKLIAEKSPSYELDDSNLIYEIESVEKEIGGTIYVGTLDGELYYPLKNKPTPPTIEADKGSPFFKYDNNFNFPFKSNLEPPEKPEPAIKNWERYDKNSFFIVMRDPQYKIETLRYQTHLDNGLELLIWITMTGISENATISNNLTAIVGGITIIITVIWALFVSSRFTRPISEMNRITKKISELDFSQTLQVKKNDEIGELSYSINQLSYNLDNAIRELNIKNRYLEEDIEHERKLDKMRQQFISDVSHELKTPIFLIQGYADGLKANVATDEYKRNFYCDVIMEETEKMNMLIKDLLDLSKMQSGFFSVNKTNFNVSFLIKSIVSKYDYIFKEKNICMKVAVEEELIGEADPIRIEQIIVNFMNNAIEHIDDKKIIKLSINLKGNKIRVSVFNSGLPIPEESIDKIWSSFYKIDKARTRIIGGTGLGLSIVRAIQEAHKCAYGVENLYDGVEFWFEIDLAKKI
ncbi:signal transduction histidine kinase [Clostridium saccharoperbutylacetonicum]|uniref:histidine kinase n=1 Tax=Clostridium saccharoperbutylacetonicum N1-4(HMT) TaxID=931276 RepID=M1LNV1_9CLOT|nr:HAMP domain-containing sensor histidine kinase [Clostridium saccharoperbutylacetonicum]AGF54520.1 sensor histidine kinase ResE [Clostridium saccharoperbutylacetonicum N1-4(HMT)]NRT58960.1 signal transduction histidine kinase [Clostridium saccharoperbutylacetonicum]NSB28148.1 signal transduction histidine kinase [Clostridium saccharoperbutylacetonicum]NSB41636.1 signal transduction histidine kinase [Clostridium saccharoperbutylacetonicum]